MDKNDLQSKIKPIVTVYLFWFLFGSHYGYLGRWNIQILFWITLGGLGIWAINDLLTMPDKIVKHRESIFRQIEEIESKERFEKLTHKKFNPALKYNLAMVG